MTLNPARQEIDIWGAFRIGSLRLDTSATFLVPADASRGTVFKFRLGGASLGDMLRYLVGLADSGLDVSLDPPWDLLNDIHLDDLTLEVDITNERVGFRYDNIGVDLTFLKIQAVELWYRIARQGRGKSVDIAVFGRLLDLDYTTTPLSWDLLNEPAPAVPSRGPKVFQLDYLGLGQHVTLRDLGSLTTMNGVVDALKAASNPIATGQNPLNSLPQLRFDAESGWLFGTRFTILETFALSAVFNDPRLYGLLVSLSGSRAGSLAGLRFEILYRKIGDNLGVYHVELQLPDVMRHLEFGEVAVTLPIVDVDVYTNGNFLVDFGFPHNRDFSRSMVVEVFPFLGAGGFYLGVLDGQTASGLPQIVNGDFHPVIAFGFGLQVAVGKTVQEGILSAGIVVAVEAILEGLVAFFHPSSPDVPQETFYRISGTAAIVAHLFGGVDFSIVKASVDIYLSASVMLAIESHQPILIALEASVTIELTISISLGLFSIHISLSFSATIRQSFLIGSQTPTPWQLAPAQPVGAPRTGSIAAARAAQPTSLAAHNGPVARVAAAQRMSVLGGSDLAWRGVSLAVAPGVDGPIPITVYFHPQITAGLTTDAPGAPAAAAVEPATQVQLVGLLLVRTADVEQITRKALRWALQTIHDPAASASSTDDTTRLSDLLFVHDDLTQRDPRVPIDPAELVAFVRENFTFSITSATGDAESLPADLTVFPMLPFLTLSTSDGHTVDFATYQPCDADYQQLVADYFSRLSAVETTTTPSQNMVTQTATPPATPPSMAASIFSDYVLLILRQVVQDAISAFHQYRHSPTPTETLTRVAALFAHEPTQLSDQELAGRVAHLVQANQAVPSTATAQPAQPGAVESGKTGSGFLPVGMKLAIGGRRGRTEANDTLASLAGRYDLLLAELAWALRDDGRALTSGASVSVGGGALTFTLDDVRAGTPDAVLSGLAAALGTSPEAVKGANLAFDWLDDPGRWVGLTVHLPADAHDHVRADDTLRRIAERFALTLPTLAALNATGTDLLVAGHEIMLQPYTAQVRENDSLGAFATRLGLNPVDVAATAQDQPDALTVGASVQIDNGTATVRAGDTLFTVAARYSTPQTAISPHDLLTANPALTEALTVGTTINLPSGIVYPLQAGDTLHSVASWFGLNVRDLMQPTPNPTPNAVAPNPNLAATNMIAPLAWLELPAIDYSVKEGDSLVSIAQNFGLTAQELAHANLDRLAGFGTVIVPDCERLQYADLLGVLTNNGAFRAPAAAAARFLLHGLRLPDPVASKNHDLRLYPLYTLTGQQWPAPSAPTTDYSVTLSLSGAPPAWAPPTITFTGSTNRLEVRLLDRDVQWITEMAALLKQSRPIDPAIVSLTPSTPYELVPMRVAVGQPIPWQTPTPPSYHENEAPGSAGLPQILPLPAAVRRLFQQRDRSSSNLPDFGLAVVTPSGAGTSASSPITNRAWATLIHMMVQPAADPARPGETVPFIYEVFSDDQNSRDDLFALVDYLQTPGNEKMVTIDLLYEANPTASQGKSLRSDLLDSASVQVIKANLSTVTHPPSTFRSLVALSEPPPGISYAGLDDPRAFLTLLWEGSVVNSGGYYLVYRTRGSSARGLPDQLFNQTRSARLSILVTVFSQPAIGSAQGSESTQPAHGFHNVAICAQNLGSADASVYVEPPVTRVGPRDTLDSIANGMGTGIASDGSTAMGLANATLPDLLPPGTSLSLAGKTYTTQRGDTLVNIAQWLLGGADDAAVSQVITAVAAQVLEAGVTLQVNPMWVVRRNRLPAGTVGFRMLRSDPALPIHTVVPGETFSTIAQVMEPTSSGADLAWSNAATPDLLRLGASVSITGVPAYSVKSGDTLWSIAQSLRGPQDSADKTLKQVIDGIDNTPGMLREGAGLRAIETPPRKLQSLFHLVGYWLDGGNGFQASPEGLPVGPTRDTGAASSDPEPLRYLKAVRTGPFATQSLTFPGVPDTVIDPYAGAGGQAQLAFQLHDVFGNRLLTDADTPRLPLDVRIQDRLIGPQQWPGAGFSYDFPAAAPELVAQVNFDLSRYAPVSGGLFGTLAVPTELADPGIYVPGEGLKHALSDLEQYQHIYLQLAQPDVRASVTTSLDDYAAHALDKQVLLDFVLSAYQYASTLALVTQVYVKVDAADTLTSIAERYHLGGGAPASVLAEANRDATLLLQVGAPLQVPEFHTSVQNETLRSVASNAPGAALSPGQLAGRNTSAFLHPGISLIIKGANYVVGAQTRLQKIAADHQTTADAIGTENADVRTLFEPGQPLRIGEHQVQIAAGDTLTSLAAEHNVSVAQLAQANADNPPGESTGLLEPGHWIAVPQHLELHDDGVGIHLVVAADTLQTIADQHHVAVVDLIRANKDLHGLLVDNSSLGGNGEHAVDANDTLATVLSRFQPSPGIADLAPLTGLLRAGARMLLPTPPVRISVPVAGSAEAPLIPLAVNVTLSRTAAARIDPAFANVPGVQQVTAVVRPDLQTVASDGQTATDVDVRLGAFAMRFEAAYPRFRLATGPNAPLCAPVTPTTTVAGPQPDGSTSGATEHGSSASASGTLLAVDFTAATGSKLGYHINQFMSGGKPTPAFFAVKPLSTSLWSGSGVAIQAYVSGKGLNPATQRSIPPTDLDAWGRDFVRAVDAFLSVDFAPGLFAIGLAREYGQVVNAKQQLANAISQRVAQVVATSPDAGSPEPDLSAAQSALYQRLLVQLSAAYSVDTIVQLPVETPTPCPGSSAPPRLLGQPDAHIYTVSAAATLQTIANDFSAPLGALTPLLADDPGLFRVGAQWMYAGANVSVKQGDTLASLAAGLSSDVNHLADALKDTPDLLRVGASFRVSRQRYTTAMGDSLRHVLVHFVSDLARIDPAGAADPILASTLEIFALLNAQVPLFVEDGNAPQPLASMAERLGKSPYAVCLERLDDPTVLRTNVELSFLAHLPAFTMSEGKITIDGPRVLTFLFSSSSGGQASHVPLTLTFQPTALEYNIRGVPWAERYEASDWLAFVRPLPADQIGDVDIPVPLRAYPVPPTMVKHSAVQQPVDAPTLDQLKKYTYCFSYSYQRWAQDELAVVVRSGPTDTAALNTSIAAVAPADDLPRALAQYTLNAQTLNEDLALLRSMQPTGNDASLVARATAAAQVFAHLVTRVANQWSDWPGAAATSPTDAAGTAFVVRHYPSLQGTPGVLVRAASPAAPAAGALPSVALDQHELVAVTSGDGQTHFGFRALSTGNDAPPAPPVPGPTRDLVVNFCWPDADQAQLDVIQQQYAWAEVTVRRNAHLVSQATSSEFVYQLPPSRFASPLRPLFTLRTPFDMTSVPSPADWSSPTLLNHLRTFWAALLEVTPSSPPSARRSVRLAASYGFQVAENNLQSDASALTSILVLTPIVATLQHEFDPTLDFDDPAGLCQGLAGFLNSWLAAHQPPRTGAAWVFDIAVYSNPMPEAGGPQEQPPLLQLTDVRLPLESTPST